MKGIKFILAGVVFGIVMVKSEAVSWYRIQEMFRFQSFHMYGIIGTAVMLGALGIQIMKRTNMKDYAGNPIVFEDKEKGFTRYILGGTIFGLGWALTGACPGPLFVNFGYGYMIYIVPLVFAVLGTLLYGILKNKLPH